MAIEQWVRVADATDIPADEGMRVEIDDVPIAVWNVDGQFYATSDTCTHEETPLSDGDLWGEVVECPLHGAQFDVTTGEALSLPAIFPLTTYPVKVEEGAVYIGWSNHD